MEERIQKIISAAGVTSRRAAEQLITEGRVRLNGAVVTELGTKADPSKDHIKVDGKLINPKQPPAYLMLNKPAGFVTTMSDPEGRPTVQDLLKGVKVRVYPVGRLDYNTEGLLLLTNDGDLAHLITHPKHEFPKTYLAKIKGVLEDGAISALEQGVFLKDGKTAPAKIKKIRKEESNSWLEITIHEGRKRQVRRMFDHMGHTVIRLKRVKTGGLTLGDLAEGSYRYLTPQEVELLRETAQKTDDSGFRIKAAKPVEKMPALPVSRASTSDSRGMAEKRGPKPAHRGATPDLRPWKIDEAREADSRGAMTRDSRGARTGTYRPRVERPYSSGTRPASSRPSAARPYVSGTRPTASSRPATTRPYVSETRPTSSRPATGSYIRRAETGAPTGRPDARKTSYTGTRPDSRSSVSRPSGPGRAAGYESRGARTGSSRPQGERPYGSGARPAPSRPSSSSMYVRSAEEGAPAGRRPSTRKTPSRDPRPDSRSSYTRPSGPGRTAGYESRGARTGGFSRTGDSAQKPTRPYGSSRPAVRSSGSSAPRTSANRPTTGAPAWKTGARTGESRNRGFGSGTQTDFRPSGPRPNRSTHSGKGPVRGPKGGGRSTGRR